MTGSTDHSLPIDSTTLAQVVGNVLDTHTAEIEQWQVEPAGVSRGSATAGVYRVSGVARDGETASEWAVILKIIRPAASDFNPAADDMDHPLYWKREALAYESGLLDNLPADMCAPHCYAVETRDDNSCWIWLEAMLDDFGEQWPLALYRHAAVVLGRFNGAFLTGRSIPDHPWLGSAGTMPGLLNAFAFTQDYIREPEIWQHPTVQAAFPRPVADRLIRLWDGRQPLLDGLERLPQTLCHRDAFRRNIFASQKRSRQLELTFIDWAYVGRGEIGLDIGDLFAASYHTCSVRSDDLSALDSAIYEGYLSGLREVGWQGDARLARFGFTAAASLKYGTLLFWLGDLGDPQRYATWEELSDQPIDIFVQQQARLVAYLLDLADEARELLPAL